jgi:hypothetical protein
MMRISNRKGLTFEQFYGQERAIEIKKKLSISHKGQIPWIKGKKGIIKAWNKGLTKETDSRLLGLRVSHRKNKNMIDEYGIEKRNQIIEKRNKTMSKKTAEQKDEICKKISQTRKTNDKLLNRIHHLKGKTLESKYGVEKAQEIKQKMKLKARLRMFREGRTKAWRPIFNTKACEYFKQFDESNNIHGHYATTSGGEFFIKELGYWPDYINHDLGLIIEVDEPKHFEKSGELKQKDVQRQREIQEFYPDFLFLRFKTENMHRIAQMRIV